MAGDGCEGAVLCDVAEGDDSKKSREDSIADDIDAQDVSAARLEEGCVK